ncbi:MAG TPA: DUF2934 domain-containing protein [Candidatus Acidoferrales bacterium]|nr:DUF2934 domain-containing protein [Candidatus Acidoferrales bacterium]
MKNPGKAASQAAATHRPNAEAIAARAYEIFVARGGEPGRDLEDWLQAERELAEQSAGTKLQHPVLVP